MYFGSDPNSEDLGTEPLIDVVCLKVGDKYGPEYVNRLFAMVGRHLSARHRFICITDDSRGLHWEITLKEPEDPDLEGWWQKMTLYKPPAWSGPRLTIFMDLDTVICSEIDWLSSYGGSLAMLRDFYRPASSWASGILAMRPDALGWIWAAFDRNRARWLAYGGDQQAVEAILRSRSREPDLLQDLFPGKIRSYKVHCQRHLPTGTAIVCFHGRPRPHEVTEVPWIEKYWRQ